MSGTLDLLVIVQGYPSATRIYNQGYVHSRNRRYLEAGHHVTVLSFEAPEAYQWEGVSVLSPQAYQALISKRSRPFDLCLSHAPNLRNHLRFLFKHQADYQQAVFFIHGHEVLLKNRYYPAPYPFIKSSWRSQPWLHNLYDQLKVRVLAQAIPALIRRKNLHLIFVSQWMQEAFFECIPLSPTVLENRSAIISNNMHPVFLEKQYQPHNLRGDFLTIRPLDEPKYAVDLVWQLACQNPQLSFTVLGKRHLFEHFSPPANLTWQTDFVAPEQLPEWFNSYRAALMPTRLDAQGVMMCEMATYGLPVLTSDLPICREMLKGFQNVGFLPEAIAQADLNLFLQQLKLPDLHCKEPFADSHTILKEIAQLEAWSL